MRRTLVLISLLAGCGAATPSLAPPQSLVTLSLPVPPQVALFEHERVLAFEVLMHNETAANIQVEAAQFAGAGFAWTPSQNVCDEVKAYPDVDAETLPELSALRDLMAQDAALTPCSIPPGRSFFVPVWAVALPDGATPVDRAAAPALFSVRVRSKEHVQSVTLALPAAMEEPALTLGPPLRDGPWVVMSGLSARSSHRWQAIQMHGAPHWAQRFAADFGRLDENGCAIPEGATLVENTRYFGYGQDVIAVADARVARVLDGVPENVPGEHSRAIPITVETVTGNAVWLDLGENRFAFYAHLTPGSIRVQEGDLVHRGDVLGGLGNSGNSTAPHLHFHVARGLGGLDTEGVPYVFERFTARSVVIPAAFGDTERCVLLGSDVRPVNYAMPSHETVIRFR